MQELMIARKAYQLIKEESLRNKTETGGLAIGTLKVPIVLIASKAGVNAKVTAISYANDNEYDNEVLQNAIKEYKGKAKLLGYWHKHPEGFPQPSAADLEQARQIVKRNGQEGDKNPVFFVITNIAGRTVELYGYSLTPDQKDFNSVSIKMVEDDSTEVTNALAVEPVIIQPRNLSFWNDVDFQSYLTKTGYERLKQEAAELLRLGHDVKVFVKGQAFILIDDTISCFLPPEYPLNPPRFFRDKTEIRYSLPIWNSTFKISDIMRDFEEFKALERRSNEDHNPEAHTGLLGFFKRVRKALKYLRHRARNRGIDPRS